MVKKNSASDEDDCKDNHANRGDENGGDNMKKEKTSSWIRMPDSCVAIQCFTFAATQLYSHLVRRQVPSAFGMQRP